MKERTREFIAFVGATAIVVTFGLIFHAAFHPTVTKTGTVSTPGVDADGYPLPSPASPSVTPAPIPPPPIVAQPPHPPKMCSHLVQTHDRKGSTMLVWEPCSVTVDHWGACEPGEQRWAGSRSYAEDSALEAVLRVQVENDQLFGLTVRALEAAECAARRWRLEAR